MVTDALYLITKTYSIYFVNFCKLSDIGLYPVTLKTVVAACNDPRHLRIQSGSWTRHDDGRRRAVSIRYKNHEASKDEV